jgi:hypothetical protein
VTMAVFLPAVWTDVQAPARYGGSIRLSFPSGLSLRRLTGSVKLTSQGNKIPLTAAAAAQANAGNDFIPCLPMGCRRLRR